MTRKPLVTRFHLLEFGMLVAITATAWFRIPEGADLPVHWGLDGHPDQVWPKLPALLAAPAIAIVVGLVTAAFGQFAPEDQVEPGRHVAEAAVAAILGLLCAIQFGILLIGIGSDIDMVRIIGGAVALALLVIGNALPKSQPNAYSGIRLPWTLNDPRNWILTHRLTGILMIIAGIALGAAVWLTPEPQVLLPATLAAVFIPIIVAALFSVALSMTRGRGAQR